MDQTVIGQKSTAQNLPSSLDRLRPLIVDGLVRVGVRMDGGYVVPASAMEQADALVSFGLGPDWSFEQEAAELNPNLVVHIYDHTVGERKYIDHVATCWRSFLRAQGSRDAVDAAFALLEIRCWLDHYEAYRKLAQGKVTHFQERVFDQIDNTNDATPETVFARLDGKQKIVLKMDIEGGEYRVIDALLTYQERIRLMVIEFHATDYLRDLFLEKITHITRHYEIVHIHGNNYVGLGQDGLPEVLELTFLHKSACGLGSRRSYLPLLELDFPNDPKKADYEFVFCNSLNSAAALASEQVVPGAARLRDGRGQGLAER